MRLLAAGLQFGQCTRIVARLGLDETVEGVNRGDGADTITDSGPLSSSPSHQDTLLFGEGIAKEDLWLRRNGNDLMVQVLGEDPGQVTLRNWYDGNQYKIEQFQLSDGQRMAYTQAELLVQAMAAIAPPTMAQTTLTAEQQALLTPVLSKSWF